MFFSKQNVDNRFDFFGCFRHCWLCKGIIEFLVRDLFVTLHVCFVAARLLRSLAAFARNNTNLDELSIVRRSKHEFTASSDFDLWSGYRNMFVPMNTSTLHWSAVANQCVALTESTACFEVCWSGDFPM